MPNSTDIELLQPGETILNGQYTIEKHLGSGGQGQVYLARHRIFDQVAVKRLHRHIADQPEARTRFERELRITYQLRGEHVILVHAFDKDLARDEWFSVMEYANSGSLEDKLDIEAPLPVAEAIQLAIILCQALAHVHQYPYVHGDLKPSNVLFHTTPNQELILKLSDFGSAFQPVQAGTLPLPSGLKAARTKLYVSPELLDASDPEDTEALKVDVDQRADIYAIGVILYEMLTGRPPFWEPSGESEDPMVYLEREHALLVRVKEQLPPEPEMQRHEILPALDDLVMKALDKDPANRFAGVDEMQARLEEILQEEKARLAELEYLRPQAAQVFEEEKWGQASDLLYKILNLDPDDQDAIEKRKVAEDQQRLMSLRLQIPRAMSDEQWDEARKLVEEALAIEPDDTELKAHQKKIDKQLTVVGILARAKEAESRENWRQVIDLCLEALKLDPSQAQVSPLLSHAQRQLKIVTLRQEAKTLGKKGDKPAELEKLRELQRLVSTDSEVNARIEALQKTIELEICYTRGIKAYREEKWEVAIEALEWVTDLDPFYRDAAYMLLDARERLEIKLSIARGARQVVSIDEEVSLGIAIPQKTVSLEIYYAQGKQAYDEERWEAAIESLERVVALDKSYRDAASMLLAAREQLAQELSAKRDAERRQEIQKLFEEGEELIRKKQWLAAWETFKRIRQDKHYQNAVSKKELLTRLFYVSGQRCAEAQEWYLAKCCFAKLLEYDPDHLEARQQFVQARDNNRLKRNYRIKRMLGLGGTSQVDYAEDMNRGMREVSLKYLNPSYVIEQGDAISRRFRRQAQRCMTLDHPNIVKILAVEMRGVLEDRKDPQEVDVPIVVMEYIEGQNLAEFLRGTQRVPERQAINFTRQLCMALRYAHNRGILHLDIKPSNILIQTNGLLKLADFSYTSHGTRGYRSPELVRRSAELDERTDIFAAGKVLYALLTGRLPIEDPLDEEDASFQRIAPSLQAVIRKATALNPADRYQSAFEMLEALQEVETYLPFFLEFRRRISDVWQAASTWQGVLALIGVLLTSIILPILAAEVDTPLGRIREGVTTYISTSITPRLIDSSELVVNGIIIENITHPYYAADTRQINIEVRVRDTNGNPISNDEILCQWRFAPPLQGQTIGGDGECKMSYSIMESLDTQLVSVAVQGKDVTRIAGTSINFINIIPQSDERALDE
jgi:serine/threonine protein kinase